MNKRNPFRSPAPTQVFPQGTEGKNLVQAECLCARLTSELSAQIRSEFGQESLLQLERIVCSFGNSFQNSRCRGRVKAAYLDARKLLKSFLVDFNKFSEKHSAHFEIIDLLDELESLILNLAMHAEYVDEKLDDVDEIVEAKEIRAGSTKGAPLQISQNSLVFELAELFRDKKNRRKWKLIREILEQLKVHDWRVREAFYGSIDKEVLRQCYDRERKRRKSIKVGR